MSASGPSVDLPDVLVIGDANPDLIVHGAPRSPKFGQAEELVSGVSVVLGGSAAITAVGLAKLGLSVQLLAVVGDDTLGGVTMGELKAAGVDRDRMVVGGRGRTGSSVILNHDDDRSILTDVGSIHALRPEDLDALPDRPAARVHVASFFLMNESFQQALPEHLRRFAGAGATTSVDTNWDPNGGWDVDELLSACQLFMPNTAELLAVARQSDVERAVRSVRRAGCDVFVKQGAAGVQAWLGNEHASATAGPSSTFGDSVGAGDSTNAAFLAALHYERPIEECVAWAATAGSLSTHGVGGTATQPTLAVLNEELSQLANLTGSDDD